MAKPKKSAPAFVSGEHRASMEHLVKQHPRGRRNSLSQADSIHRATTMDAATAPKTFDRATFAGMRNKQGKVNVDNLLSEMHPTQEKSWDPSRGGGRAQIRTGRKFEVPDSADPNRFFMVRVHTNDNTIDDKTSHAHSNAVTRIEHFERIPDPAGKRAKLKLLGSLMGGRGHKDDEGDAAWHGNSPSEDEINASHIPTGGMKPVQK